jgi:hypothetical protein
MPSFMARVKRCFTCTHWRAADPSHRIGQCTAGRPPKTPFWHKDEEFAPRNTFHHQGVDCAAYVHDKRKPHPLDNATALLLPLHKGDVIHLRTYLEAKPVEVVPAEVIGHGKNHVRVRFFNAEWHIRIRPSERHRAGTVIGWESWGIDPHGDIVRAGRPLNKLDDAEQRLAKVIRGSRIQLVGWPPFDGVRKTAYVVSTHRDYLVIRVGNAGKKLTMQRTGPMAGIVTNDPLWTLYTGDAP